MAEIMPSHLSHIFLYYQAILIKYTPPINLLPVASAQTLYEQVPITKILTKPNVKSLASGNLVSGSTVFAWKSFSLTNTGLDINFCFAILNSTENEILVDETMFYSHTLNYTDPYERLSPDLKVLPFSDGSFLILYRVDYLNDSIKNFSNKYIPYFGEYKISIFSNQGTILKSEVTVLNEIFSTDLYCLIFEQRFGAIDILDNGNIVVVWDDLEKGTIGKILNSEGNIIQPEFIIDLKENDNQLHNKFNHSIPSAFKDKSDLRTKVIKSSSTSFVVVWINRKYDFLLMNVFNYDGFALRNVSVKVSYFFSFLEINRYFTLKLVNFNIFLIAFNEYHIDKCRVNSFYKCFKCFDYLSLYSYLGERLEKNKIKINESEITSLYNDQIYKLPYYSTDPLLEIIYYNNNSLIWLSRETYRLYVYNNVSGHPVSIVQRYNNNSWFKNNLNYGMVSLNCRDRLFKINADTQNIIVQFFYFEAKPTLEPILKDEFIQDYLPNKNDLCLINNENIITVNQHSIFELSGISVFCSNNGDFIVIWEANDRDGSGLGVVGRIFNSNGLALQDEFIINTRVLYDQYNAKAVWMTNNSVGKWLVTWYDDNINFMGRFIFANSSMSEAEFLIFKISDFFAPTLNFSDTYLMYQGDTPDVYYIVFKPKSENKILAFKLNNQADIDEWGYCKGYQIYQHTISGKCFYAWVNPSSYLLYGQLLSYNYTVEKNVTVLTSYLQKVLDFSIFEIFNRSLIIFFTDNKDYSFMNYMVYYQIVDENGRKLTPVSKICYAADSYPNVKKLSMDFFLVICNGNYFNISLRINKLYFTLSPGDIIPIQIVNRTKFYLFELPENLFSRQNSIFSSSTQISLSMEAHEKPIPLWLNFNPNNSSIYGQPTNVCIGNTTLTLVASNEYGTTVFNPFTIFCVNNNPYINFKTNFLQLFVGEPFEYNLNGTFGDFDGDECSIVYVNLTGSKFLKFDKPKLFGTPASGDQRFYSINITVQDIYRASTSNLLYLTVLNRNPYANTIISNKELLFIDQSFSFLLESNTFLDPDGDLLTYEFTISCCPKLKQWIFLNSSNFLGFYGKPITGSQGNHSVEIRAKDKFGGFGNLTLYLVVPNRGIKAGELSPKTINVESSFNFIVPANIFIDDDKDPLNLTANMLNGSNLPLWLQFNNTAKSLSGIPKSGDQGLLQVKISAYDSFGGSNSSILNITVANRIPLLKSALENQTAYIGVNLFFSYNITQKFTDPDADTIFLKVQQINGSALPNWLEFNSDFSSFSGTPNSHEPIELKISAMDLYGGVTSSNIMIKIINRSPTCNNMPNQTLSVNEILYINTTGICKDPDGDIVKLDFWLKGSNLPAWVVYKPESNNITIAPKNNTQGTYNISLNATDLYGGLVLKFFFIIVKNKAPMCKNLSLTSPLSVGKSFSLILPSNFCIDPDLDLLKLSISGSDSQPLPSWIQFNSISLILYGKPVSGSQGSLQLISIASDPFGGTSNTSYITLTVYNSKPIIAKIIKNVTSTFVGTFFNITLDLNTFIDLDGDSLTYLVNVDYGVNIKQWLNFDERLLRFYGTPVTGSQGDRSVNVTVFDPYGSSTSQIFWISVINRGINAVNLTNTEAMIGINFKYTIPSETFYDEDGDILKISASLKNGSTLPTWLNFFPTLMSFTGTPATKNQGLIQIRVKAEDNFGKNGSSYFNLTVVNRPPTSQIIPDKQGEIGTNLSFSLLSSFNDPDGDQLKFSAQLDSGASLPSWLKFNSTTVFFSGVPDKTSHNGLKINIKAQDGFGGVILVQFKLVIVNRNPICSNIQEQSFLVGSSSAIVLPICNDPDGDAIKLSFTLDNGSPIPSWLAYDTKTKILTAKPNSGSQGITTIKITATDDFFGVSAYKLNLSVVNTYPKCNVVENIFLSVGISSNKSLTNCCQDPDSDPLTISVSLISGGALPSWMKYDSKNNNLLMYPVSGNQGSYKFQLRASDNFGGSDLSPFSITVLNKDPICENNTLEHQILEVGKPFSYNISSRACHDDDGDPLSYVAALDNGANLPEWIIFDRNTLNVTAIPKIDSQNYIYTIKIIVSDLSGGSSAIRLPLQVINKVPVARVAGNSQLKISVGKHFNHSFAKDSFYDPDGDPLIIGLEYLNDPLIAEWINFDKSTLTLFGKAVSGSQGNNRLKITATDGFGGTGYFIFTLAVRNQVPYSNPLPSQKINVGKQFQYQIPFDTFVDPDGDPLVLSIKTTYENNYRPIDWLVFDEKKWILFAFIKVGLQGDYIITVVAGDGLGGEAITNFTLSIINLPPQVKKQIEDQKNLLIGQPFSFIVPDDIFTDPDGDRLTYRAELENSLPLPSWLKFQKYNLNLYGTPDLTSRDAGPISIMIVAEDPFGGSAFTVFKVFIENRIPNCKTLEDQKIFIGLLYKIPLFENICKDPDDDKLNFNISQLDDSLIPQWMKHDSGKNILELKAFSSCQGFHYLKLVASDRFGGMSFSKLTIFVENRNPECKKLEDSVFSIGNSDSILLPENICEDFDGDSIEIDIQQENRSLLPLWINYNSSNRNISLSPKSGSQGIHSFRLFAKDQYSGHGYSTFQITISNNNPICSIISSQSSQNLEIGSKTLFIIPKNVCIDKDGDELFFGVNLDSGAPLPDWITFNNSNMSLILNPVMSGNQGIILIKFTAFDGFNGSFSFRIPFLVNNKKPVLNLLDDLQITVSIGIVFNYTFPKNMFIDPDGDILVITVDYIDESKIKMASWLNFNMSTYTLYGKPLSGVQGSQKVRISANDAYLGIASFIFVIQVQNSAPIATKTIPDLYLNVGKPFQFAIPKDTFTDTDGDSHTFKATLESGYGLMNWLVFDESKNIFFGTPKSESQGEYKILVTAQDIFGGKVSSDFNLIVSNLPPVVKKKIQDQNNILIGQSFSFTIPDDTFYDPDGDHLTYEAYLDNEDSLPEWIVFQNLIFSGNPESSSRGSLKIVVEARDREESNYTSFNLTVLNRNPECKQMENAVVTIGRKASISLPLDICNDKDGDKLYYSVKQENLLPSWLEFDDKELIVHLYPESGNQGIYYFKFTAEDNYKGYANILFQVTVFNNDPVCSKITDSMDTQVGKILIFNLPENVCSDQDGDNLSYAASLENGAALPSWIDFDLNNRSLIALPESGNQGVYSIKIQAKDNFGGSTSLKLILRVINSNPMLSILQIPQLRLNVNIDFVHALQRNIFIDPDGDSLFYSVDYENDSKIADWLQFDSSSLKFFGKPARGSQGLKRVKLIAQDAFGGLGMIICTVSVENLPPQAKAITNQEVDVNKQFYFAIPKNTFLDSDEDPLVLKAYLENGNRLMDWLVFDDIENKFIGIPRSGNQGSFSINISAQDPFGGVAFSNFNLKVRNSPPVVKKIFENQINVTIGQSFSFLVPDDIFYDFDGDRLVYRAEQENGRPLPAWLKFHKTNLIFSGIPESSYRFLITIVILAEDNFGGSTYVKYDFFIENRAPNCLKLSNQAIPLGRITNITFPDKVCEDPDGDPLNISIVFRNGSALSDWIYYQAQKNVLQVSPVSGSQGTYEIELSAIDNYGMKASSRFFILIENSDPQCNPLDINSDALFSIGINQTIFLPANTCQDRDGDSVHLMIRPENGSSLPPWIYFNNSSEEIYILPVSGCQGTHLFKLIAKDDYGGSGYSLFKIIVSNSRPEAGMIENQAISIGEYYQYKVPSSKFIDRDGDQLSFKALLQNGSKLIGWLNFNPNNQTFFGTPLTGSQDVYKILLIVSDGHGEEVTVKFTLEVINTPPKINRSIGIKLTYFVGQLFVFDVPSDTFYDPDGDELVFSANLATGASLPGWMRFNPLKRVFTGMPIPDSQGLYYIQIIATDPFGGSVQDNFTFNVPNRNLLANKIEDQKFSLENYFYFRIPNNAFYSEDGNKLYYNALLEDSSNLPEWLKLVDNEAFSGTPTRVGNYKIKLIATDLRGENVSLFFFINVTTQPTSKTFPKINGTIPDQIVIINQGFGFTLPPNLILGFGLNLYYTAKLNNNDDPLPQWLSFHENNLSFSGTPQKGDHITNKTKIAVEVKNQFSETTKITFNLDFFNHNPKAVNSSISKSILINQEYSIYIPIEDEDGDRVTCKIVSEKPLFLELDSFQCKCICSPQKKDYGYKGNITVLVEDGFGGQTKVDLLFQVDYSDFDNLMRWINTFLPIISSLGGVFAVFRKRSFIWNIFAFWARPIESFWDVGSDSSFKILRNSAPGWITDVSFVKNRRTSRSKEPEVDEKLRKSFLKNYVEEVRSYSFKKKLSLKDKLPFLDFLTRKELKIKPLAIDWRDISVNFYDICKKTKGNLLEMISDNYTLKLLVFDTSGRVLEKITCYLPNNINDYYTVNRAAGEMFSPPPYSSKGSSYETDIISSKRSKPAIKPVEMESKPMNLQNEEDADRDCLSNRFLDAWPDVKFIVQHLDSEEDIPKTKSELINSSPSIKGIKKESAINRKTQIENYFEYLEHKKKASLQKPDTKDPAGFKTDINSGRVNMNASNPHNFVAETDRPLPFDLKEILEEADKLIGQSSCRKEDQEGSDFVRRTDKVSPEVEEYMRDMRELLNKFRAKVKK